MKQPEGQAAPRTPDSLRTRAMRGSVWSLVIGGLTQVLRLGSTILLRAPGMIPAADFGIAMLVNTCTRGIRLFADIGIAPAIIQSPHGDERAFLDTAWTIQSGLGLGLFLVSVLLAWPLAGLYQDPDFVYYVPVAGLSLLLSGLFSTKLYVLKRNLSIRTSQIIDLVSFSTNVATMLVWAWWRPSVWALLAGSIAEYTTKLLIGHFLLPGVRNWFRWERQHVRQILTFGRWILLSTAVTFLAQETDKLILGNPEYLDKSTLGILSLAVMGGTIPLTLLKSVSRGVGYAAFCNRINSHGPLARTFRSFQGYYLLLAGGVFAALFAGGPAAVRLLFSSEWHEAGWMLQILAVSYWIQVSGLCYGDLLLACGRLRAMTLGHALKLVTLAAALPTGYHIGGLGGALLGVGIADLVRYLWWTFQCRHLTRTVPLRDLLTTALVVACALGGAGVEGQLQDLGLPALIDLVLICLTAAAPPMALGLLLYRRNRSAA